MNPPPLLGEVLALPSMRKAVTVLLGHRSNSMEQAIFRATYLFLSLGQVPHRPLECSNLEQRTLEWNLD